MLKIIEKGIQFQKLDKEKQKQPEEDRKKKLVDKINVDYLKGW